MLAAMAQRMPNFTLQQKLYLLQRIQFVVDTVQDFRKDTTTVMLRNAAWEQVVQAFNAAFPDRPPSSKDTLKTLWKRLKVECRAVLHRRLEQQAAGLTPPALTQVQREVIALVPNLISNHEDLDGDGSYVQIRAGSPVPVTGATGTSSSEQEDADNMNHDDVDSKEQVAISVGLVTPTAPTEPVTSGLPLGSTSFFDGSVKSPPLLSFSSTPSSTPRTALPALPAPPPADHKGATSRGQVHFPPSRSAENSWQDPRGPRNAPRPVEARWEARRQEQREREHEQTMRLLQLQQSTWEEKRRAARQKERAARAKRRYYQAKMRMLGSEVPPSSSDSEH